MEVADQTFYLTQSQYNYTRPTSPSGDPIMPGARDGSAQTIVRAATLREKFNPSSHSILTLGQPVPAPTLQRQAPGYLSASF